MIYNLDLFGIGDSIVQACRTFVGWIAVTIYTLIEYMYHVFELLGRTEIIEDSFVATIYSRVGMILGVFMVFKLIFSLIQSLIEPDKFNDKKSGYGQIIKRSVISIVLLGITPSLFREAFNIQNYIVGSSSKDNVIYKLIAGSSSHNKGKVGRQLAGNLFFDFVTDVKEPILKEGMVDDFGVSIDNATVAEGTYIQRFQENNWENFQSSVLDEQKDFGDTLDYLAIKNSGKYVIELDWFPLLVVGGTVLYIIALYCVQVAIRVVQLAYLQLIAPVPILSYISDPEGSFKKWTKQCLTTYLDLFIILAIIYFVMTVISEVLDQFKNMSGVIYESAGLADEKWHAVLLVKAFIIIGLLLFGKKVPELLKDLFPNLGGGAAGFGFGLGLKKNLLDPLKDVGKSLYNTPLGWGLKGGKKLGTYIDRKAHHLPKPRGKFGQAIDKWLPGHADAHKSRLEMDDRHKLEQEGKEIYAANGGKLTANDFSSNEYRESWTKVKKAKDELEQMDKEVEYYRNEIAQGRMDPNNSRYQDAIKRQKAASSRLDAAKQDHENIRKIHAKDARKEDAFKYYKDMHGSDNSSSSGRSREEIISNISEMRQANGKEERTGFTDAERQAEAQRRESQRSSYNNEHESQLASQSIFSDNEAMRQSDMEYNTGVSRPNASDNGAPTAENSIFNDNDAMRESDARYNQTQNSNNDTRVYQNGDDVGE